MIYTELTKLAMKTAYKAHEGQTDRSGLPYIFHPFHLAEQMDDEITAAIALLHDVVEDTPLTLEDLRAAGFPESVVEGVRLLTHEEGTDYFDYIRRLKDSPTAKKVKLADLAHNSDASRYAFVTERDLKRLEKYEKAKRMLTESEQ